MNDAKQATPPPQDAPRGCPLRSTGDLNYVWEWNTPEEMQMQLAGYQPREEYLQDRVDKVALVVEQLGLGPESEIFEIGSGEGIMAAGLADRVRAVLCADVSRSFLDKARATCEGRENVSYHHIENDFLEKLPTAAFDAGFSLNVFIHLNVFEVFLYFRQIRRILRPGGLFCFNFLDLGDNTRGFFHTYAERYRDANPVEFKGFLNWHGVELMTGIAAEAGLTPVTDKMINHDGVVFLTLRSDGEPAA
ncbi:methyltransferase [Micromonospora sp. ATCC 39149]|uniref:Class I SAM-dependent methyltransferase n=1 Tax=Micromonospora carbonacea TaxID=47853 RepID=A0A7D6C7Y7_9ACTN|nr:class I SAM-dependent methyltransferase [Micromonospora sp. ATCC 39149]EEP73309.1 methyltransferase [Micromonospora sp. ATCC 39149]QLJ99327.1 class I SAM-dependent methyltransferase [Micromonospora carbonacea]